MAKFLSGLNSNFQGIGGQILVGEIISSLNNVYARVLKAIIPSPTIVFGPSHSENSALVSMAGRG